MKTRSELREKIMTILYQIDICRSQNIEYNVENIIRETIRDKHINLSKIRNEKFENNYATINEFTDGKNIERIYRKLKELNIIK